MATTQQPLNPYIAGKAVGGERGFFGRQDVLREVERTLTSPDQNALVLFGQRRVRSGGPGLSAHPQAVEDPARLGRESARQRGGQRGAVGSAAAE